MAAVVDAGEVGFEFLAVDANTADRRLVGIGTICLVELDHVFELHAPDRVN